MRLENFLVPVSHINCKFPCSFDQAALEQSAQLIIDCGGVINPLILRKNGTDGFFDTYEVVDGCFEYHAAVRAEELEPMHCESINAYIIPPKQEPSILRQIDIFRQNETSKPVETTPIPVPTSVATQTSDAQVMQQLLDKLLPQIESTINKQVDALLQQLDTVNKQVATLDAKFDQKLVEMDARITELETKVNSIETKVNSIETKVNSIETRANSIETRVNSIDQDVKKLQNAKPPVTPIGIKPGVIPPVTRTTINEEAAFIDFLNGASAQDIKGLKAGIQADKLLNARDEQPFQSRDDVIKRVRGMAAKTYDKAIANWRKDHIGANNVAEVETTVTQPIVQVTDTVTATEIEPELSTAANSVPDVQPAEETNIIHPVVEVDAAVDVAPIAEAVPVVDVAPIAEAVPVVDVVPIAEAVPVVDVAPIAEAVPVVDVAPTVEDVPATIAASTEVADTITVPQAEQATPQPALVVSVPTTGTFDLEPINPPHPAPQSGIHRLNSMNERELVILLDHLKLGKNTIIEEILKQRPFASFDDMKIPGLGKAKKQKIVDAFPA